MKLSSLKDKATEWAIVGLPTAAWAKVVMDFVSDIGGGHGG
jgi:hypothetical protein